MNELQTEQKRWLVAKLVERGRGSRRALAEFLKVGPEVITRITNLTTEGEARAISLPELIRIAEFFKEEPPGLSAARSVGIESVIPVWGRAGAGGVVNNFHETDEPIDHIPRPDKVIRSTGAVEITGASLGRPFDGWYALYDEVETPPTQALFGRLCVVETEKGRVYVKKLQKAGNKFNLISSVGQPIRNVSIKWAARVTGMVPR